MFFSPKQILCGAVALILAAEASADNQAIIGGRDYTGTAPGYGAFVSSSNDLVPLALTSPVALVGIINSVSMNGSGNSLIGGQGGIAAYAAIVSSSGVVTPLIFSGPVATNGNITTVSINSSGNGLIGGRDTTGPMFAALVPVTGNPIVPLTIPEPAASGGIINSVSLNDAGNGLLGGQAYYDMQPAFFATVSPSGAVTEILLAGGIGTEGVIRSVSINSSGKGLIGGKDLTGAEPGYAAVVSGGVVTPLTLAGGIATTGSVNAVAINSSGKGVIGGQDQVGTQPAYAALVSASGVVTPLTFAGGMTTSGLINSVAINPSGACIIGGQDLVDAQPAYAALVSPSGVVTPLTLTGPVAISGGIYSVAINSAGNGIIGGQDQGGSEPAFAALFTSSGTVIPLTFSGGMATTASINSVALPLFEKIATASLSGNNLIFANYINTYAPDNSFYFIPASLDGTLSDAVESAAPTRNGISTYTASNNLFNLTTIFANHTRNQQRRAPKATQPKPVAEHSLPTEELTASLKMEKKKKVASCPSTPMSVWLEVVSALAYQKAQHETVPFDPITGGVILAVDGAVQPDLKVGGGISYLYTHIHEEHGQGHSNINQEEVFLYSSWEHKHFYIDTLLLFGAFQTDQVRKIKMSGFSFESTSHPNGWQLLPHLEVGYRKNVLSSTHATQFDLNPFLMVDWANAWQDRYRERGSGPFNASQKSYYGSLLRTEAGLRFYEALPFQSWNLTIEEKISYINTQSFNGGKVNAFLVSSPGSFTVETLSSAQNLGAFQFALTFDPVNAYYPITTLFYQGEFGSRYQSHQLNLELAWQF